MFCAKCGKQILEGAAACRECDTSFASASPAEPPLVVEKVKRVSTDALHALKIIAPNPVAALASAFESLGQNRALGVGIAFGALFAFCVLFSIYGLVPVWARPQGFGGLLRILVVAVVPFFSLLGASTLARTAFRGIGGLSHDAFIAGSALLPLGAVAMVAGVLGYGNIEVVAVLALFGMCLSILMLFAGLTRVDKLSEQSATLAVPLMLIVSAWLSKIIYAAML